MSRQYNAPIQTQSRIGKINYVVSSKYKPEAKETIVSKIENLIMRDILVGCRKGQKK